MWPHQQFAPKEEVEVDEFYELLDVCRPEKTKFLFLEFVANIKKEFPTKKMFLLSKCVCKRFVWVTTTCE